MLKMYYIKFVLCVCVRVGARVYAGVGDFIYYVCMLLQINVYFLPYFLLGHAVVADEAVSPYFVGILCVLSIRVASTLYVSWV